MWQTTALMFLRVIEDKFKHETLLRAQTRTTQNK